MIQNLVEVVEEEEGEALWGSSILLQSLMSLLEEEAVVAFQE
jgi:hypothetical protein